MASPRYTLDGVDGKKLLISFGLGVIGFVSAWVTTELVPAMKESESPMLVLVAAGIASFSPVLFNAIRKWFTDHTGGA